MLQRIRVQYRCVLPAFGVIAALSLCSPAGASIIIDRFNVEHDVTRSGAAPKYTAGTTEFDGAGNDILGDYRNISLLKTGGTTLSQLRGLVDPDGGLFSLSVDSAASGKALISYTGTNTLGTGFTGVNFNAPTSFNLGGGAGIDITENGANQGIRVRAAADNQGLPITFTLYNSASNYVRYTLQVPGTAPVMADYFMLFTSFSVTGGMTPNQILQTVKAITVEVNAHPNGGMPISLGTDAQLDYIMASSIPEPGTYALMGLGLFGLSVLRRRITR
jgi:hypothetical protein